MIYHGPDIFFLTYGLWNMWYGNKRDSCAFEKNVSKWLMELRDKEGVNVNKKIVWITLPHVIRHPKINDNMVQYRNNCARKIYNENGLVSGHIESRNRKNDIALLKFFKGYYMFFDEKDASYFFKKG